jgi:hypothetical protein
MKTIFAFIIIFSQLTMAQTQPCPAILISNRAVIQALMESQEMKSSSMGRYMNSVSVSSKTGACQTFIVEVSDEVSAELFEVALNFDISTAGSSKFNIRKIE